MEIEIITDSAASFDGAAENYYEIKMRIDKQK
jgi:hypothetical protein